MAFCLDCHRHPDKAVRPLDKVYDLDWKATSVNAQIEEGSERVMKWEVNAPLSCSGCHR